MSNEKREVQKKILFIYKQVLPLLEANNINFTANGGTCIGACREKGFIAWDDDMDINIIPSDHQKLFDMIDSLENSNLYLIENQMGIYRLYYKGIEHKGQQVFIDFIMLHYVHKVGRIRKIILFLLISHMHFKIKGLKNSKFNSWYIKYLFLITTFWFPKKLSKSLYLWFIKSRKKEYVSQITKIKWYFGSLQKKEFMERRIKVPFEDTYMYVPYKYDAYLSQVFGNWKTPINDNYEHYK